MTGYMHYLNSSEYPPYTGPAEYNLKSYPFSVNSDVWGVNRTIGKLLVSRIMAQPCGDGRYDVRIEFIDLKALACLYAKPWYRRRPWTWFRSYYTLELHDRLPWRLRWRWFGWKMFNVRKAIADAGK